MPPSSGITVPVRKRAGPRGEEERRADHVLGGADPADRDLCRDRRAALLGAEERLRHLRLERAGGDRVDA